MPQQVSDTRLPVNAYFIFNPSFEIVPAFTAATNVANRWINGLAAGSTSDDSYGWAVYFTAGTSSSQFDTSVSKFGSASLKLSTTASGSQIVVAPWAVATTPGLDRYLVRVKPSTKYTLKYWMKTTAVSGSANSGARIRVRTWNATASLGTTIAQTSVTSTTDWTEYSVDFTTSATDRYVSIEPLIVGNDGTATLIMNAWFDGIRLVEDAVTRTAAV